MRMDNNMMVIIVQGEENMFKMKISWKTKEAQYMKINLNMIVTIV